MTLCVAGMQPTREFISLVAWHLLTHTRLRAAFEAGDHEGRMAILEEILRLEPIVSTIYRRVPDDLPADKAGGFEPGRSYAISLRGANIDEGAGGACPLALDPARKASRGDQGGS